MTRFFERKHVSRKRMRFAMALAVLAVAAAGYVAAVGVPTLLWNWEPPATGVSLGGGGGIAALPPNSSAPQYWYPGGDNGDHGAGGGGQVADAAQGDFPWRPELAVLLVLVGLTSAATLAGWRRVPRRFGPSDVPVAWR